MPIRMDAQGGGDQIPIEDSGLTGTVSRLEHGFDILGKRLGEQGLFLIEIRCPLEQRQPVFGNPEFGVYGYNLALCQVKAPLCCLTTLLGLMVPNYLDFVVIHNAKSSEFRCIITNPTI